MLFAGYYFTLKKGADDNKYLKECFFFLGGDVLANILNTVDVTIVKQPGPFILQIVIC